MNVLDHGNVLTLLSNSEKGPITQLVEHNTGISEVRVRILAAT